MRNLECTQKAEERMKRKRKNLKPEIKMVE